MDHNCNNCIDKYLSNISILTEKLKETKVNYALVRIYVDVFETPITPSSLELLFKHNLNEIPKDFDFFYNSLGEMISFEIFWEDPNYVTKGSSQKMIDLMKENNSPYLNNSKVLNKVTAEALGSGHDKIDMYFKFLKDNNIEIFPLTKEEHEIIYDFLFEWGDDDECIRHIVNVFNNGYVKLTDRPDEKYLINIFEWTLDYFFEIGNDFDLIKKGLDIIKGFDKELLSNLVKKDFEDSKDFYENKKIIDEGKKLRELLKTYIVN
jgi:hypothetical protein